VEGSNSLSLDKSVTPQFLNVPAFAKINLSLHVLSKRANGYHELDTVFQTVSLHDTLQLFATDNPDITLSCDDRRLPIDEGNLVRRAADALRQRFKTSRGARIRLEKRIPTQAGLGGGSSNAAITLIALNHLWELNATRQDLLAIAAQIGADVPFFLFGGTARGKGVGAEIAPLTDADPKFLLIIKPNAQVNTADAYKFLDERSLTLPNSKFILSGSRLTEIFDNAGFNALHNDFEEIAFELVPEISRANSALINAGAGSALLAGSGSAVFGVFDSEDAQRRAIQAIELETGWRVFPCKTVGRDEYQRRAAFAGDLRSEI